MTKLNKDILFLLFEELQDDSKSLFSCLLVNRLWCETVVPVLWRNPWHYDISYRNKSSLFNIVPLSLSDDIKEILTAQGIQFPSTTLQQPLLFDYLSFCRSMNVNAINDIISVGSYSAYNQFLLQKEIYGHFMRKCPELKYLDMRSIEHQLFYIPEANTRLDSLCELICDTHNDSIYFYGLAGICNGIEKLIIVNNGFNTDDDGIVKLIKTQRNLKYFEWKEDFNYWDDFEGEIEYAYYKNIYLALIEKAHTLSQFIITSLEGTFSPEVLSELHKLRTLKLNLYDQFEFKYEEALKNSVYPDLEILQLGFNICIDMVTCIIKSSEGHIRKISIYGYFIYLDDFHEQSLSLIYAIYEKCLLVEYLSIAFPLSKEHSIEFEKLLKACQKLRVLLLDIKHTEDDVEFFKVLSRSAPINLKEIRFHLKFSLETLGEFLESWRGRPALSIFTSNRGYENEKYMEIVSRYKNDGVLRDFRCVDDMYF